MLNHLCHRIMKSDVQRVQLEQKSAEEKIKENNEKIKMHKQLPYLVSNVVEILDLEPDAEEDDGAAVDVHAKTQKAVVIKTTTRQVSWLIRLYLHLIVAL